eukprot:comp20810_c0_seq1/m.27407 comp20810_c0_seq1/g.27407  ORF comp20810_c0_seq1/g.27407 comp20810_c0_seq1/m.27407 type:complete len:383 (-) comp20810_c0_seq1:335-1483(-)
MLTAGGDTKLAQDANTNTMKAQTPRCRFKADLERLMAPSEETPDAVVVGVQKGDDLGDVSFTVCYKGTKFGVDVHVDVDTYPYHDMGYAYLKDDSTNEELQGLLESVSCVRATLADIRGRLETALGSKRPRSPSPTPATDPEPETAHQSESEPEADSDAEGDEESDFDGFDLEDPKELCEPEAKKRRLHVRTDLELADYASVQATQALYKALREVYRDMQGTADKDRHYSMDVEAVDNLYTWRCKIVNFDPSLPLVTDLEKYGYDGVELELRFGPNYPHSPPFVRVVKPRFNGRGGGHVMAGGSICMDLLYDQNWSCAYSIPSLLLQIKTILSTKDISTLAQLDERRHADGYTLWEAVQSFKSVSNIHKWKIPEGLLEHIKE